MKLTMVSWLYDFPASALMFFASGTALALVLLTGLVARQLPTQPARSAAALDAYKVIVSFLAILLSFSLVQANALLRAADVAISAEAGAMNQLDRFLVRSHTTMTDAVRPRLQSYMQAVLKQDWPAMRQGLNASDAQSVLGNLNRAVMSLTPADLGAKAQFYPEIIKYLDAINDARQARMDSVDAGLPAVLWETTWILCTVLIVLAALNDAPSRLVALGGHAIAIGVLLALTFAVDKPHRGTVSTTPAPIERVLALVQARAD